MGTEPNDEMPKWFKPHADLIYLTLRRLLSANKSLCDLNALEAKLHESHWRELADGLNNPDASLQQLRAILESQRARLAVLADDAKKLPMAEVKAIDRFDVLVRGVGITIPEG